MITFLDAVTATWLIGWAIYMAYRIMKGGSDTIQWVILVHVIFTGVPILLDMMFGALTYERYPGFELAVQDDATHIVYDFYVALVPLILWFFGRSRKSTNMVVSNEYRASLYEGLHKYLPILWIILVAPLPLILLSPNPAAYLQYGLGATTEMSAGAAIVHQLITLGAKLSLVAGTLLLLAYKRMTLASFALVMPWVGLSIWLQGKRSIVALLLVLIIFVLWQRGALKGYRFLLVAGAALIFMGAFSVLYQGTVRDFGGDPRLYEISRIDFGRDNQIKMTIYAELHPEEMQILEYRGQSVLFYASMYVPRSLWPDKPFPYAQYYTSALFLVEPRLWGWGMTTSWLEEAIANFSWLGLLIGPLVPAWVSRTSDSSGSPTVRVLGLIIAMLLLVLHFVAFAPLAILWSIFLIKSKVSFKTVRTKRRRKRAGSARTRRMWPPDPERLNLRKRPSGRAAGARRRALGRNADYALDSPQV